MHRESDKATKRPFFGRGMASGHTRDVFARRVECGGPDTALPCGEAALPPDAVTLSSIIRPLRGQPKRRRAAALQNAFTLAELIVSVGILALLMVTVGVIFSMSTKATNLSNATNEIMNVVRAFEQQVRRDFQGLRKDAFFGLCYNYLPPRRVSAERPEEASVRADWFVFFANGEFQTIRQRWDYTARSFYGPNAMPISSNLARIEYGMLGTHYNGMPGNQNATRLLSRSELGRFAKLQVIDVDQAANTDVPPNTGSYGFGLEDNDPRRPLWGKPSGDVYENWEYEFATLADWRDRNLWPAVAAGSNPSYATRLVGILPRNLWLRLGYLDVEAARADHLRMIPGCVQFQIQRWAERNPLNLADPLWTPRWWPESGVDYPAAAPWQLWEYFNGPLDGPIDPSGTVWRTAPGADFPKAVRVTIWLLDSNGRLLQNTAARTGVYDVRELGAQDYSFVITLE